MPLRNIHENGDSPLLSSRDSSNSIRIQLLGNAIPRAFEPVVQVSVTVSFDPATFIFNVSVNSF